MWLRNSMQGQGVQDGHLPPGCAVLVGVGDGGEAGGGWGRRRGRGIHVVQGDTTRVITRVTSPSRGRGCALTVLGPRVCLAPRTCESHCIEFWVQGNLRIWNVPFVKETWGNNSDSSNYNLYTECHCINTSHALSHGTLLARNFYGPHFTDKEIEGKRG